MKRSLFIHMAWAVVAIISFVMGAQFFASDDSPGSDEASENRSIRRASNRSASRGAGDSSSENVRVGNRGRSIAADASMGKVRLTADEIETLGNRFRTSNNPLERRLTFSKLLEGLTPENAKFMREQVVHLPADSAEFREFHYAWGAVAGEQAVLHGQESPKRDMAVTLSGWASADPDAALAYYDQLSDGQKNRGDLKWGTATGLANVDPGKATDFVLNRLAGGDKDSGRMIRVVADAILRSGNPEQAAQWSAALPAGQVQNTALGRVAGAYAAANPEKAVSWLQSLPDGDAKSKGIGSAFSAWAGSDPAAASDRLNQLSNSSMRDSAVGGYVRRMAYKDPRGSIEWANTINNSDVRNHTLVHTGRVYLYRDPKAARKWLANSDLAPEIQKKITHPPRKK